MQVKHETIMLRLKANATLFFVIGLLIIIRYCTVWTENVSFHDCLQYFVLGHLTVVLSLVYVKIILNYVFLHHVLNIGSVCNMY